MSIEQILSQRLSTELAAGEHVLWSGRSNAVTRMLSQWMALPFGLVWTGFTGAASIYAMSVGDMTGVVFGLLFVGVGLFLLATPLMAFADARRTLFAITDRRLLVIHDGGQRVDYLEMHGLHDADRVFRLLTH